MPCLDVAVVAVIRHRPLGDAPLHGAEPSLTAVGLDGARCPGCAPGCSKSSRITLSGLLSSLAGIMIIAQAGSASSTGLGSDLLLPRITAAIVGGTAITGGITESNQRHLRRVDRP